MVNAQRKALERLWKDRCTVYHRVKVKDPMRCEISRNMKGSWRVNSLNLIRRGAMLMIF